MAAGLEKPAPYGYSAGLCFPWHHTPSLSPIGSNPPALVRYVECVTRLWSLTGINKSRFVNYLPSSCTSTPAFAVSTRQRSELSFSAHLMGAILSRFPSKGLRLSGVMVISIARS